MLGAAVVTVLIGMGVSAAVAAVLGALILKRILKPGGQEVSHAPARLRGADDTGSAHEARGGPSPVRVDERIHGGARAWWSERRLALPPARRRERWRRARAGDRLLRR